MTIWNGVEWLTPVKLCRQRQVARGYENSVRTWLGGENFLGVTSGTWFPCIFFLMLWIRTIYFLISGYPFSPSWTSCQSLPIWRFPKMVTQIIHVHRMSKIFLSPSTKGSICSIHWLHRQIHPDRSKVHQLWRRSCQRLGERCSNSAMELMELSCGCPGFQVYRQK